MLNIVPYFQMHQPFRLKKLSIFDIGKENSIFDNELDKSLITRISEKSYIPALEILLNLVTKHDGRFKFGLSLTGPLIQQLLLYNPKVIDLVQKLINTKCCEILAETYYHSLASLYDENEFIHQVNKHINTIYSLFGVVPTTFRNTELIYSNKIADMLRGFKTLNIILTEGAEKILEWKLPIRPYKAYGKNPQLILLRHHILSEDISINFNNKNWKEYPLTAEKYAKWCMDLNYSGNSDESLYCNIFMDLETFGEHHDDSTGIFEFLKDWPTLIFKIGKNDVRFTLPFEIMNIENSKHAVLNVKDYISWNSYKKDISAFAGNEMQKNSQMALYKQLNEAKLKGDEVSLEILRKLSSSDNAFYMATAPFLDTAAFKYFSYYPNAETAYQNFLYAIAHVEELMA
ncbi:MAG: glycoside hydrolase family 57 protein [Spirochaetes bacterium]|nr:glycoside hydrolase family 57 protein [Spirochaetota bacterium]MBP8991894.1 glycoside hydrolase family 57 protein [Spirochaetota bacterium]HQQ19140.1 glycoside hydrolase family 57 protein [Exilispira sp.]